MWSVLLNEHNYTPKRGDTVLDIGAHRGYFALHCAMHGASVVAYEPEPQNFKLLQEKAFVAKELGGALILPQQAAVWSESGERRLWLDANDSGANSMVSARSEVSITAKTVSFGEALGLVRWDCVKLDVEGAEAQILLSAKISELRQIAYLTMELHNNVLTREQHSALVLRMHKDFPRIEKVPHYEDGLKTDRFARLFAWGNL